MTWKEAAKIDGCDEKENHALVSPPHDGRNLLPIRFFLAITRAFVTYDVNISLTEGGPYGSTTLAAMYVYNMAFSSKKYGLGQAEALILFSFLKGEKFLAQKLLDKHSEDLVMHDEK